MGGRALDGINLALVRSGSPAAYNKRTDSMFRALLTLAALAVAGCVTAPPVQEMSDARQAISAAEAANAERLAPESLRDARRFLAEAEELLQQQAYGPARFNAVRAKNRATMALKASSAAGEDRN
jgi:prophage DNA circulation protein